MDEFERQTHERLRRIRLYIIFIVSFNAVKNFGIKYKDLRVTLFQNSSINITFSEFSCRLFMNLTLAFIF